MEARDKSALRAGLGFSFAFTSLIWILGGRLASIAHLPDTGAAWYYWKLPAPTFWGGVTAWGCYLAHQLAHWAVIYRAQNAGTAYSDRLHRVNLVALGLNAAFVFLHLVQTHLFYDGLARDVSVFSSQASVVVLLVWVLLMETPRRGLFLGRKIDFGERVRYGAKRYHGYYFSWAVIYTFWFHPMEATSGHLIGFFYMFLLLLQGSLFFTRVHTNRWWTFALEIMVLFHGSLVAYMQAGAEGFWPMFFFGFAGIFVITQMHGLGLSARMRWALLAAFVGGVCWVYAWRGWERLGEIFRIPMIDYLLVFVLAGLVWIAALLIGPAKTRA